MNQPLERKPTAVWRYVAPIALGVVAVGALVFVISSFVRPADASIPVTPTPLVIALQATTVPTTPTVAANDSSLPRSSGQMRVSGNFLSASQASLAFQMPGRLGKLAVKEGDRVKQGDLIASLDTSTLELQITQAQAGLTLAQARLNQTKTGGTDADIAAAQTAVAAAQANYERVAKGPTPDDIAIAKSNLDKAKAALDQAQSLYDKAGGATNPYFNYLPTTLNLQLATSNYQAALGGYNLAKNHPTVAELAGAAVQLAQAQSALARMTPTTDNLAIAQAQVDQAQAALDAAKQSLSNAKIVAPFDGTVIWIGPHVSESVGANITAVVIADLTQMQVQANVDEMTLADLKVGQPASMTVDALGGRTLTGHISKIGMLATTAGGVVSVPVTINVDPTDAPIYPGLSALVQFQGATQ